MPYTTEKWDEDNYVREICDLKSDFDLIVVCVNPSCEEKKHWITSFEKCGIPCVIGAKIDDKNALIRMHRIFQHFEFMTTNSIGSHVAYAAYSGCKVSIYGTFEEYSEEDVKNNPLYLAYPHVMKHNLTCSTKEIVKSEFPFLFVHPKMADCAVDWANEQLGESNRLGFFSLASQLGWLPHQQAYHWLAKIYAKIREFFK